MENGSTGYTGGLYPGGRNIRPQAHNTAGRAIANQIVPLNRLGQPDRDGKIAMISIGMSNTAMEFGAFMERIQHNPRVNPRLVLVNGAQENRTAERWVDPQAPTWLELDRRLARAGVTPKQVQVAWVKQTLTRGGDFPAKAQELQGDLETIARNLKVRFPNIKLAYVSSRTRSYTYWRGLSPEPVAFETGFAVKWLIEKQITGDPGLNYDPANGVVKAPYLSWGPYLWTNGGTPRSDGLVWTQANLIQDCTHPSASGVAKVVDMLMSFFGSDDTTVNWFLVHPFK